MSDPTENPAPAEAKPARKPRKPKAPPPPGLWEKMRLVTLVAAAIIALDQILKYIVVHRLQLLTGRRPCADETRREGLGDGRGRRGVGSHGRLGIGRAPREDRPAERECGHRREPS